MKTRDVAMFSIFCLLAAILVLLAVKVPNLFLGALAILFYLLAMARLPKKVSTVSKLVWFGSILLLLLDLILLVVAFNDRNLFITMTGLFGLLELVGYFYLKTRYFL